MIKGLGVAAVKGFTWFLPLMWATNGPMNKRKRFWVFGVELFSTLWLSIRLRTRSMSPCTGWSSASWGSTLYNQSIRAWRASVNWPENNKASSSLFCLQYRTKYSQWGCLADGGMKYSAHWENILTFPLTSHKQCPICPSVHSACRPASVYHPVERSCLSGPVLFEW